MRELSHKIEVALVIDIPGQKFDPVFAAAQHAMSFFASRDAIVIVRNDR